MWGFRHNFDKPVVDAYGLQKSCVGIGWLCSGKSCARNGSLWVQVGLDGFSYQLVVVSITTITVYSAWHMSIIEWIRIIPCWRSKRN